MTQVASPAIAGETDAPAVDLDQIEVGPLRIERGLDSLTKTNVTPQIGMMMAIRNAVIAATEASQWTQFGDKMYLNGSGGSAIAFLLGLRISAPEYVVEELPGGGAMVTATVTSGKGARTWTDHDECTTFDDMLPTRVEELKDKGATPPAIAKIILSQVKKKAFAGAVGRAVSGWVGIRDLTFEALVRLGLKVDDAAKVGFRKGKGKASGDLKPVSLGEAEKLPKGSRCKFGGRVTAINRKDGKKGPYCDIGVGDGGASLWVRMWKAPPEWLEQGASVFFPEVKVGEWQGKPQFVAEGIEKVDTETGDPSNGTDQRGNQDQGRGQTPVTGGTEQPADDGGKRPGDGGAYPF